MSDQEKSDLELGAEFARSTERDGATFNEFHVAASVGLDGGRRSRISASSAYRALATRHGVLPSAHPSERPSREHSEPETRLGGVRGRNAIADAAILIEPLIPKLRRYATGLLQNRAAADDLVQDTLERAVSRWHHRRQDGDARTWLFAILHNLSVDRLRQTARRGNYAATEDVEPGRFAQGPCQGDGMGYADVMLAVQALPEDYRSILLLASVEGLSYAEIAAVLGMPPGTVMSRLFRARDRLSQITENKKTNIPILPDCQKGLVIREARCGASTTNNR